MYAVCSRRLLLVLFATHSLISSSVRYSFAATAFICGVMIPFLAASICVIYSLIFRSLSALIKNKIVSCHFSTASAKRLCRSKLCCIGPDPAPRSSIALSAPWIYSFARLTASSKANPFARFEAIAEDSVHPVPWVFGLSILHPSNHWQQFFVYKRSLASFTALTRPSIARHTRIFC